VNHFRKTLFWPFSWLTTLACLMFAHPATAQETEDNLFPTSPEAWLNCPPISSEALKNKAAILYFFEEG